MSAREQKAQSRRYVPRNWRLLTAAGVTSLGLAAGLAQPAIGAWWKSRTEPAPEQRVGPPETGFAATIRRLQAESRAAADQGDHARAVKLAERAAKISEAAAQVLGNSDCSPQETARFLAETRALQTRPVIASSANRPVSPTTTRTAIPAPTPVVTPHATALATSASEPGPTAPVAASNVPEAPVGQPAPGASSVKTASAAQPTRAPAFTIRQVPPAPAPTAPTAVASTSTPQTSQLVAAADPVPPEPAAPTSPTDSVSETVASGPSGPPLFGPIALRSSGAAGASQTIAPASHAGVTPSGLRETERKPAPSRSQANELLAQSRIAAAEEDFEHAIDLAQQALQLSASPSLFGAGSGPGDPEVQRWIDKLQGLRTAAAATETNSTHAAGGPSQLAKAPDKQILIRAETQTSPQESVETAATPLDLPAPVESAAPQVAKAAPLQEAASTSRTLGQETGDPEESQNALWQENLPPAPAPPARSRREPIRFSRSVISRSSGWIDAEEFDAAQREERGEPDAPPAAPSKTAPESARAESRDAIPEFPLTAVSTPGFSEPDDAASTIQLMGATDDPADSSRGPLRLRGKVQFASADEAGRIQDTAPDSPASPPAPPSKPKLAKPVPVGPETARSEPKSGTSFEDSAEGPVQRFPVQRVLRLRDRLIETPPEQPAAPSPSADWMELEAAESTATPEVRVIKASPVGQASTPVESAEAPRVTQGVPARKPLAKPATDVKTESTLEPERHSTPESVSSRAPLRLRNRMASSEVADPSRQSTRVPQAAEPREPAVGHSQASTWKSVEPAAPDTTEPALSGSFRIPDLEPPVAQAAFASPAPGASASAETTAGLPSIALPPELPSIAPPPPEAAPEISPRVLEEASADSGKSSQTVSRSSFGLLDRLAESYKLPMSALISLIGIGGLMLSIGSLIVMQSALRRRHDS